MSLVNVTPSTTQYGDRWLGSTKKKIMEPQLTVWRQPRNGTVRVPNTAGTNQCLLSHDFVSHWAPIVSQMRYPTQTPQHGSPWGFIHKVEVTDCVNVMVKCKQSCNAIMFTLSVDGFTVMVPQAMVFEAASAFFRMTDWDLTFAVVTKPRCS